MKFIQKYIIWILATLILVTILFLGVLLVTLEPTYFCVNNGGETVKISIHQAENGNCYVFLPSYADMKQVTVHVSSDKEIYLGRKRLSDGMVCREFQLEKAYEFKDTNQHTSTLFFYQSANIATMYIDTISGNMERVHSEKGVEETATISVVTTDGVINHKDTRATLKGRGNTTWSYNKKPYSIKLSAEADLLGMGSATNWVLLANAADSSHLNNKIIYELANRVGFYWTPEGEYVDVYINGEYNGLYLLSEKVEVAHDRLELNLEKGDFFCEFRAIEENEKLYCTQTSSGRSVVIEAPKSVDDSSQENIHMLLDMMEREILSEQDLTQSTLIDVDSWVKKYIIDEFSANVDSDRASCHFYYSDGKFFAGPIWDYDKGFGNCQQSRNPQSFVANNKMRSGSYELPYYYALYNNPSFQNRVQEIYKQEFLPHLEELLVQDIGNWEMDLSIAKKLDGLRWEGLTPDLESSALISTNFETVQEYLKRRVEFLNRAWLDEIDYRTVQFELESGAEYVNYAIENGKLLDVSDMDICNTIWYVAGTEEMFDPNKPITQDLILVKQYSDEKTVSQNKTIVSTREIVTILSLVILLVLLVCMVITEIWRNTKRRN